MKAYKQLFNSWKLKNSFSSFRKLHAELKTTKVEEMKVQLEMCYQEIVRLQNLKDTEITTHAKFVYICTCI